MPNNTKDLLHIILRMHCLRSLALIVCGLSQPNGFPSLVLVVAVVSALSLSLSLLLLLLLGQARFAASSALAP